MVLNFLRLMRFRSFFPSPWGGQRDFLSYFTAGGNLLSKSMEFLKNPTDFSRMWTAISPVFRGVFVPGRAFSTWAAAGGFPRAMRILNKVSGMNFGEKRLLKAPSRIWYNRITVRDLPARPKRTAHRGRGR